MPAQLNLSSAKITRLTDGDVLDGDPVYSQVQIVISSQDRSKARITVRDPKRTEYIEGVTAVESMGRDRWRLVTTGGDFEVVRDARRCCGSRR